MVISNKRKRSAADMPPTSPIRYQVRLEDFDMQHLARLTLPFAPFSGLMLRAPFYSNDYVKVDEVYWDDAAGEFQCFLEFYEVGEVRNKRSHA